MATWSEVQEHVRSEYTLDVDQPGEMTLTLHSHGHDGVRGQRVMVRSYQAWGRDMMEVRSAFGELGDYEAEALLADNLQLPIGAVALHGRYLVLVHKACLSDMTVDGALFLITQLSVLADALEARKGIDRF